MVLFANRCGSKLEGRGGRVAVPVPILEPSGRRSARDRCTPPAPPRRSSGSAGDPACRAGVPRRLGPGAGAGNSNRRLDRADIRRVGDAEAMEGRVEAADLSAPRRSSDDRPGWQSLCIAIRDARATHILSSVLLKLSTVPVRLPNSTRDSRPATRVARPQGRDIRLRRSTLERQGAQLLGRRFRSSPTSE